jgi:Tfp pilus assembly protein PilW
MSIEQHGPKVPVENLPPYPHTKEDTVVPAPEHRDDKDQNDRRRSLKTKLGLVLAGVGLLGTGGLVAKSAFGGNSADSAPDRSPAASATPTPGPETTTPSPEVEQQADAFGISATDNPTFEDAVKAYYSKLDEYMQSSSDTYDKPGDPQYLTALFGVDWQNNSELSTYVSDLEHGSVTISTNHFATGENGDPEYENHTDVTEVRNVTESDDQVAGEVTVHGTDNVMETVLAANASTGVDLDQYGHYHLTFTNKNGNWVVTEVDNLDNN